MQKASSRLGQVLGLAGSAAMVLAALGLPWLRFETADIHALGMDLPMAQVIAALGSLGVTLGAIGWCSRRPLLWSTALFMALTCSGLWLLAAAVAPTTGLMVPPGEQWALGYGFDLCSVGLLTALLGSALTLITAPPPTPRNAPRTVRLGRGLMASVEMVNPRDGEQHVTRWGWFSFDATTATGLVAAIFAQALVGVLIFSAGVQ